MIELQNVANSAFPISLENLLSIVAALTAFYQFTPECSPSAKKIKTDDSGVASFAHFQILTAACLMPLFAGGVATGSDRISYAGLQTAFFYSVFQGYTPDTDLDNVRNRVVGILLGLLVTAFVFNYIWPEWSERGERHVR